MSRVLRRVDVHSVLLHVMCDFFFFKKKGASGVFGGSGVSKVAFPIRPPPPPQLQPFNLKPPPVTLADQQAHQARQEHPRGAPSAPAPQG